MMPVKVIKRLNSTKGSKVLIIPSEWLEHHRNKSGQEVTQVEIELGDDLVIRPARDNQPN